MKLINILTIGTVALMAGLASSSYNINIKNASAITDDEAASECQAALDQTYLNIDTSKVVTDIRLPYKGIYSTYITWASDNEEVVKINSSISGSTISKMIGEVKRPSTDTYVTLTATANLDANGKTYKATKDFYITVLKATSTGTTELPLAFSEDFSDYLTGIDLSNYYKWKMAKGDNEVATIVHKEDFPNINNMVSSSALKIDSKKMNTDTCYDATINLLKPASGSTQAVLEGFTMFNGDTNGVAVEFINQSSGIIVSGFQMSSTGYSIYRDGKYVSMSATTPVEGVWQKFRLIFRTSGMIIIQLYSWPDAKYVDITKESGLTGYIPGYGVTSGSGASINGLRIRSLNGKKIGATYLSDLKLDTLANLPETTAVTNPNRADGLGVISNYKSSILALKGTVPSGIDPSAFIVPNRFNASTIYTLDKDYTVSTVSNSNADDSVVTYTHTFTLLRQDPSMTEREKKTITQTVYYDDANNTASITGFKSSYLKKAYDDNDTVIPGKGYSTISGNVIRDDSVFSYIVLPEGADAPTAGEVIDGTRSDVIDHSSITVTSSFFSIDTSQLDITKIYDIYGVTSNGNGSSKVYSAVSISTKVNIETCADLYQVSSDKDTSESECVLLNDLDFSDYEWAYDTGSLKFAGTLDGRGHTISNLSISTPDSTLKVGLFASLGGTVKNLTFKNAYVAGFTDVGIIAGNLYSSTISNVNFISCEVAQDESVSGGDGYFGMAGGRVRSGASVNVNNINIKEGMIDCSQRTGLITGGVGDSNDSADLNVKNVYIDGTINTQNGASVGGIVGRNRGNITVDNAIVFLDVVNAKKEVAAIVGKHEKGTLTVTDAVGDLKVESITQTNYFSQFIGTVTPSQATYTASDVTFINEDYSNLGDSIVSNINAIDLGNHVNRPTEFTKRWWEENTFIRDIDTSLIWQLDSSYMPEIRIRTAGDISFATDDFIALVNQIDETKIIANHYYIYKAYDIYSYLTAAQKAEAADYYAKLQEYRAKYEAAISVADDINSLIDGTIGQGE